MATLKEFVKGKEFGGGDSDAEPFPLGKTEIDISKVGVEEREVEFDGVKKPRWILSVGEKKFWAGTQIMNGVKDAEEAGFSKVSITKKGEGIKTKYKVMPLMDSPKEGKA